MTIDPTLGTGGVAVAVISFFIRKAMADSEAKHQLALQEIKDLERAVNSNSTKIEVLSNNHNNIEKKIDSIFEAIKDLSTDIKRINQQH